MLLLGGGGGGGGSDVMYNRIALGFRRFLWVLKGPFCDVSGVSPALQSFIEFLFRVCGLRILGSGEEGVAF